MHDDGNVRPCLHCRQHQVPQKCFARVFARARRDLQDHGTVGLVRRLHDRLYLLHVVHVERRHAVLVFGGMIEQLAQGHHGHGELLSSEIMTASTTRSDTKPK